jgi:hypothetical protein
MPTSDAKPNENLEGQLQGGEAGGTMPTIVAPQAARCDAITVRQCIDAVEQFTLDSHRDGGITDDELRITMRAAEGARQTLAGGNSDLCTIVPIMFRQILQSELEDDEG